MGLLDALLGRSTPPKPNLDALFALPNAAITLEAAVGLKPTGVGSVCFKAAEGGAFARAQADLTSLLRADQQTRVEQVDDDFGFTWLVCRRDPADLPGLATDLHAVNSTLADAGFGPGLLCSMVVFAGGPSDGGRDTGAHTLALVYLYKRGTFYPFAPTGAQVRDTAFELHVRAQLGSDLPVEKDLTRWFPLWSAPGLLPPQR
jgi:hypothetical protein